MSLGVVNSSRVITTKKLYQLTIKRTIYIPKKSPHRQSSKTKNKKLVSWAETEAKARARQEEASLTAKIDELAKLTHNLKLEIKRKDDIKKLQKISKEKDIDVEVKQDDTAEEDVLDEILGELKSGETSKDTVIGGSLLSASTQSTHGKKLSLFELPSNIKLPGLIQERLGASVKYLINNQTNNYQLLLTELRDADGFKDLTAREVHQFLTNIPLKHRYQYLPLIKTMINEAELTEDGSIYDYYMSALADRPNSFDSVHNLFNQMLETGFQPNILTFGHLIKAAGKSKNLEYISDVLNKMKEFGLEPNLPIYNNILHYYCSNNYKSEALDVFSMLKFLSKQYQPDTSSYASMIIFHIREDEIERALDLYKEMIELNIEVNQAILIALAKGCAKRPELLMRGFDFIFQIYDSGFKPELRTIEYLIYISSKDGDLGLSRAVFNTLFKAGTVTSKSFLFLLMAYRNYSPDKMPTVASVERGALFRRNLITSLDFKPDTNALPFLPTLEIKHNAQIIAESNAMWAFMMVNYPQFLNSYTVGVYLDIARQKANLSTFMERYNETTYFDNEGSKEKIIIEEPEEDIIKAEHEEIVANDHTRAIDLTRPPILDTIASFHKVKRDDGIYRMALLAASSFKNYDFAQQVWSERGQWRKTSMFRSQGKEERDGQDFKFALEMVLALTNIGLVRDALAIVESTENQFKWNYFHLKPLFQQAIAQGDDTVRDRVTALTYKKTYRPGDFRQYVHKKPDNYQYGKFTKKAN